MTVGITVIACASWGVEMGVGSNLSKKVDSRYVPFRCEKRGGKCCMHMSAQPWGVRSDTGATITVNTRSCCWCGPTRLHYVGIVEGDHGPYVSFQPTSKIVVPISRPGRG